MKIAITGGAGYVGAKLVPHLLKKGHHVTVLDTFWYGDYLGHHQNLRKIKGDIRKRVDLREAFKSQHAVIHLACVSNDPSFDMNPDLGRKINYSCFKDILSIAQEQNIARFIYASSSSVYGVSPLAEVTEDSPKKPLTDYSKFKLQCEIELQNYGMGGVWTIVRPATVCGFSPRLRLDLVVNILTAQALVNKEITLFGTEQKRPNIHIEDMCLAYEFILDKDERLIDQQIYNVGFENLSLLQIADLVREEIGDVNFQIKPTKDPRSYHVCSNRIEKLGFKPKYDIRSAISNLKDAFKMGLIKDPLTNPNYYNIKKMKELDLI